MEILASPPLSSSSPSPLLPPSLRPSTAVSKLVDGALVHPRSEVIESLVEVTTVTRLANSARAGD